MQMQRSAIRWTMGILAPALWVGILLSSAIADAQLQSVSLQIATSQDRDTQENLIREIDDPGTGVHWRLERDEEHPGGPGRMILVGEHEVHLTQQRTPLREPLQIANARPLLTATPAWPVPFGSGAIANLPVIHAGDSLVIEEHTAVVDARLELWRWQRFRSVPSCRAVEDGRQSATCCGGRAGKGDALRRERCTGDNCACDGPPCDEPL